MQTITISTQTEELIISQNGTSQNREEKSPSETDKFLKANAPFVVWLIFLAFGGGILALYYARIGYLPDIEWQAVLIYLFIGSVVGGTIGLLLTISLLIPGVLWSEFIIFDRCFEKHFSYDFRRKEPCMRSIIICLGMPFLLLLLISHVILPVGRAFNYWGWAALLLLLTFWLMRIRFECILLKGKGRVWDTERILKLLWPVRKHYARQTFKYAFWFTLSVFLGQLSMYVIYRLSGNIPFSPRFWALTTLCTAGVWISNHVVAFRYHRYPWQAVVASLVAAGLLLFIADNFSSLSMRLMNYYGIGDDQKVNVLLTDHGRDVAKSMNVQLCGTNALCGAEILSKVGDEYFLKVDKMHITIPKSDVVSVTR